MRLRHCTLAAILLSLLAALGDASVAVKPDEPLYGAIAEGMWLRHDWVVPMFNGLPAWYKPPLLYWMAIGVMSLVGPSTLALRLVTVTCGCLLLWATFRLVRRLFDTDTAWTAVLFIGTSLGFVEYSRAYMMDLPLAWLYVECCDRLWVAVMESRRSAWIGLGAWAGLACLFKGPVVVLVILVGAAVFSAWTRRWASWHVASITAGVVVGLVLLSVWPLLVWQRGQWDGFFHDFILRENLGKFSDAYDSSLVLWSSLLLQLLPWTFLAIGALFRYRKGVPETFLLVMALSVLVVFMLPQRKLPHYVVPAVPLLLAYTAAATRAAFHRLALGITVFYSIALSVLAVLAWRLTDHPLNQMGLLLCMAGLIGSALCLPSRRPLAFLCVALFWGGFAWAQEGWTTTLDPIALRQAATPGGQVCGMEVGMAVNDVVTPMPLAAIQWGTGLYQQGIPLVIRRRDAEVMLHLPFTPDEVTYHYWRWRDGLSLGDILKALQEGKTDRLQEEILVIRPHHR